MFLHLVALESTAEKFPLLNMKLENHTLRQITTRTHCKNAATAWSSRTHRHTCRNTYQKQCHNDKCWEIAQYNTKWYGTIPNNRRIPLGLFAIHCEFTRLSSPPCVLLRRHQLLFLYPRGPWLVDFWLSPSIGRYCTGNGPDPAQNAWRADATRRSEITPALVQMLLWGPGWAALVAARFVQPWSEDRQNALKWLTQGYRKQKEWKQKKYLQFFKYNRLFI